MSLRKGLLTAGLVVGSTSIAVLGDAFSPALAEEWKPSDGEISDWYLTVGSGFETPEDVILESIDFNVGIRLISLCKGK